MTTFGVPRAPLKAASRPRYVLRPWVLFVVFISCLVVLPITFAARQSFWIDEATTWDITSRASIGEVWGAIRSTQASEAQMPGYLLYAHLWARIGGTGEAWSRLSNLAWLLLAGAVWWSWSGSLFRRDPIKRTIFLAMLLSSPFLTYYALEYRPYAALTALGGVTVYGLLLNAKDDGRGRWLALTGLIGSTAFNMLSFVQLPCVILYEGWRCRRDLRAAARSWLLPSVIAMLVLLPLGLYYAETLAQHAGGMRVAPTIKNLAFIFYELLGFDGLGPSRNVLHVNARLAGFFGHAAYLAVLAIPLAILSAGSLRRLIPTEEWKRFISYGWRVETVRAMVVFAGVGTLALWLASLWADFRILGRHTAFFFLPFLAGMALLFLHGLKRWRYLGIAALLAAQLLSSMRLVLKEEYARDDYRTAVAVARRMARPTTLVVLTGSKYAFRYYGIPSKEFRGAVLSENRWLNVNNPTESQWETLMQGWNEEVLIVLSKPYLCDVYGVIERWIATRPASQLVARPSSFQIWWVEGRGNSLVERQGPG